MRAPPLSAIVLSLAACQASPPAAAPEQAKPAPQAAAEQAAPPTPPPGTPKVGGYNPREVGEAPVVQAADEAVKLLRTSENDPSIQLAKIRAVETQVVAGMNYRLDLELTTAKGPKATRVVVFHGLDAKYELVSSEAIQ